MYCGTSQYCNTLNQYLECCTSVTTFSVTGTEVYTETSTLRNGNPTVFTSTQLNSDQYRYSLFGCYSYTCYNSTAASSCTGSCTNTALACTDPNWPFCASAYMTTWSSDQSMTSGGAWVNVAKSFWCDTTAYGLEYDNGGNWPSVLSAFTSTVNYTETSTSLTWTPTVVPYSMSQASQPASAPTLPGPTSTSGASTSRQKMSWICLAASSLWVYYGACSLL